MKKIIYIVCGILISGLIIENTNFIYAENEEYTTVIVDDNVVEDNELIFGEDTDNLVDEYKSEEVDDGEKSSNTYETLTENDKDGLSKVDEIQTFEINQVYQKIDTSDYGIIRIKDPSNTGKGITIHDRNLGATATGAGVDNSKKSFGYYFQWGNNYGFSSDSSITISTTGTKVDASSFGPGTASGYYSSDTFIKGGNDWSSVRNDNLRGGSGDSRNGNGWGYPVKNASDRRGPCPEGWHIPSIGEWSKLLEFRKGEYPVVNLVRENGSLYGFINNSTAFNAFNNRFYIPLPGKRTDDSPINENIWGLFWSSSPSTDGLSFRISLAANSAQTYFTDERTVVLPIRCFYDSYRLPVIITYDTKGGYWDDDGDTQQKVITYTKYNDESEYSGNVTLGTVKRDDTCGENENKKCMFAGWHTLSGNEMWTGNISEDITLYAKWLEFDNKDISISGVNFTVMDRNLGSFSSGTSENAYGYYLKGGEKDILCPAGYHIPSTGEWLGIQKLLGSDFNGNSIKDLLDLPFAGKISDNGIIEDEGTGYYLTSNGNEIMYAKINDSGVKIEYLNKGDMIPVRCFKNYNTGTIKFEPNGGNNISDVTAVNWREDGAVLEIPHRDYSTFSGWYTTSDFREGTKIEKNINYKNEQEINLYAKWKCEEGYHETGNKCEAIYFDIKWIDGNGNTIKTDSVRWGTMPSYTGVIPTRNSTNIYNYIFNGNWLPEIVIATGNAEYIAQFNQEIIKKSGGGSGGGGGKSSKDPTSQDKTDGNIESTTGGVISIDSSTGSSEGQDEEENIPSTRFDRGNQKNSVNSSTGEGFEIVGFSQEFIDAYNFAYQNGITIKSSIYDAKMYSPLTRIQMAKMLSQYAINILGKQPDISKGTIKFSDVSNKLNNEYDNAVTIAYQLGIMGQNIKNNNFRPNDEVTRAEFATALSRMLYGTQNGIGKVRYYGPHISKLYAEGIINNPDSDIIEKRGYVMIMLMRNYNKQKSLLYK